MPDPRTTLIWSLRDEVSASAKRLNNNLDQVGVKSKGATGALGKLGVATGGLVTPTSLAAAGALAFVGAMTQATRAAIADEESQNRLKASLETNVRGWDGNTDAIEANIKAKQRLGFSDEELRDSLTVLAGATNDVAEAQKIMNTAMDLARFKGIDLKTASEALIKVEGGAYRSLKQLGIKLKDGATSTEALAAVQKVAAGQAEAYGDTTAGAMEAAEIAIDELTESFGTGLVPVVGDAARVVTNLTDAFTNLNSATGGSKSLVDEFVGAWDTLQSVNPVAQLIEWGNAGLAAQARMREVAAQTTEASDAFVVAKQQAKAAGDKGFDPMRIDAQKLKDELRDMKKQAQTALGPVLEAIYGPEVLKGQEAGLLGQIRDTKAELKEAKKAGDNLRITELQGELAQQRSDLVETRVKMAALGDKPAKDSVSAWLLAVNGKVDNLNADTKALITSFSVLGGYTGGSGGGGGGRSGMNTGLASSGPVMPGITPVGENGMEYLIRSMAGGERVSHSTPGGRGDGGGSRTPVVLQLVLDRRVIGELVDEHLFYDLQIAAPQLGRA